MLSVVVAASMPAGLRPPPPPVHVAPVSDVDGVASEEPSAPPWDPSPAIPTARFEADDGTVAAVVEVRPPSPMVGEEVTVRLSMTDRQGRMVHGSVDFGTSSGRRTRTIVDCVRRPEPGVPEGAPSNSASTAVFVFHVAGRHALTGHVEAAGCSGNEDLVVVGALDVRPGTVVPNLVHKPTAAIAAGDRPMGATYGRDVWVRVMDFDGFVASATFDMGDGTPPRPAPGDHYARCREVPARHMVYGGETSTGLNHYFPEAGTYLVKVTATTTACDGSNPQDVTVVQPVVVR